MRERCNEFVYHHHDCWESNKQFNDGRKESVDGEIGIRMDKWSNDCLKHRKLPDCETLKLRRGRSECNGSNANGTDAMDLRSGWQTDARLFTPR